MSVNQLFGERLRVINIGLKSFYDDIRRRGDASAVHVDWNPPAGGDPELRNLLRGLDEHADFSAQVAEANASALERINRAQPVLIDVRPMHEVRRDIDEDTILHAGPPAEWDRMCGPLRGAILAALRFEGKARSNEEAEELVVKGRVRFEPNHDFDAVGPMTGITTRSMPVLVVKNLEFGNVAYCTLNEGLGKVLRFGANDEQVLDRLRWIRDELGPSMHEVLDGTEGIPLKPILAQALSMGDEMHQRNIAASSLFGRAFFPLLAGAIDDRARLERIISFISENDQWFLNIAMAAGKATMDPVKGIPYSTVVTAMARNGTSFGIRVSGLDDTWFEAGVEQPKGLYFPGYSETDANPDIGDSTIVESFGFGGMAMAAAPAVTRFVGVANTSEATRYTQDMAEVCVGSARDYLIPALNFAGVPTAIDIRRVVETGIRPVVNTGIAHREAGVGQIGAGVVHPPFDCFAQALRAVHARYVTDLTQGQS